MPYQPSARWVFHHLLQDGTYSKKGDYRHLLGILSKARKGFYDQWNPGTLADDTRAPVLMQRKGFYTISLRGWGFKNETEWLETLIKELNCPLDRKESPSRTSVYLKFSSADLRGEYDRINQGRKRGKRLKPPLSTHF